MLLKRIYSPKNDKLRIHISHRLTAVSAAGWLPATTLKSFI
jgi:hypothetical protein